MTSKGVRPACCGTAEQGIAGEEAFEKGMEEKSNAWKRELKSMPKLELEGMSRREASEKVFAKCKVAGRVCGGRRAHFVEKGSELYAKA